MSLRRAAPCPRCCAVERTIWGVLSVPARGKGRRNTGASPSLRRFTSPLWCRRCCCLDWFYLFVWFCLPRLFQFSGATRGVGLRRSGPRAAPGKAKQWGKGRLLRVPLPPSISRGRSRCSPTRCCSGTDVHAQSDGCLFSAALQSGVPPIVELRFGPSALRETAPVPELDLKIKIFFKFFFLPLPTPPPPRGCTHSCWIYVVLSK